MKLINPLRFTVPPLGISAAFTKAAATPEPLAKSLIVESPAPIEVTTCVYVALVIPPNSSEPLALKLLRLVVVNGLPVIRTFPVAPLPPVQVKADVTMSNHIATWFPVLKA